jgi:hypothetical protein
MDGQINLLKVMLSCVFWLPNGIRFCQTAVYKLGGF